MRIEGTFTVADFKPAAIELPDPVATAMPVGVSTMEKRYAGKITGRSSTTRQPG